MKHNEVKRKSAVSDSLQPHGHCYSPWNSLGQNSGVGSPSLFQGNEIEVNAFPEFPCFLYDPTDVSNLISGSSAFSRSSLYIWKFLVHVLLKSRLENFEHYFASMWDESNCAVVWAFFGIAFLWDWNKN